jgi:hypothetical protein
MYLELWHAGLVCHPGASCGPGSPKRAEVVSQGHMLRIDLGTQVFDFKTLELQCDETFRPTRLCMEAGLWSVDLGVIRD